MMYTSAKFESKEPARSQVEHLHIQPRLTLGHDGCRWLRSKMFRKQVFARGLAEPQTMHTATGAPSKPICQ